MASSSEAFSKFKMWEVAKTPLKVTVVHGGKTVDVWIGRIGAIDPVAEQVAVAIDELRRFASFDIDESDYLVESSRVVATRNEADWLIFEELD